MCKRLKPVHGLWCVLMALSLALGSALALPLNASAQGEWPRCAGAPFRFPSGNWVWYSFTADNGGHHGGVDLVDRSREYTTTPAGPSGPNSFPPYFEGNAYPDGTDFPSGVGYPENTIPVYAPISGYFNDVGWNGPFPGSAFLTATLDPVFSQTVPTRSIRIWFAHMSNFNGSVMYITHPTGSINEGDLIGYQGQGNTNPVHLHFEIDDGNNTSIPVNPSTYLGAPVAGPDDSSAHYYAISCNKSPVGGIESPAYNASVLDQATIAGFVVDPSSVSTTGIDQLLLYRDGFWGSTGVYLGAPTYGQSRPDVAQRYNGNQFLNSGYYFNWNLAGVSPGRHSLHLYAHQTSSSQWLLMDVRYVNVQPYVTFSFFHFIPFLMR
jgi:hypothetical protein